jgi:hypothetical protein
MARRGQSRSTIERIAKRELTGVGDPTLGEWLEFGVIALHLRRRLTPAEQASVGPAIDIRHDRAQGYRRPAPVRHIVGANYTE